jgi:DNA-binding NarL/FixJ family response regulator
VINVVVVDDERLLRTGLRALLESEPDLSVVGEAGTGGEAVEVTLALRPDVVLMDVRMPSVDGIEAIRRLRAARSQARILVITTFDVDEYVVDALNAGATGFLLKDAPHERLVDAVRATARGDTVMDPAITRRLVGLFLARPNPDLAVRRRLETLTPREVDVLRALARGASNAEAARRLYLTEGTVKSHVNRILAKLELESRLQAAVLAYETGLVRPGDTHPGD